MSMDLLFKLNGVDLTDAEAKQLLSTSNKTTPITINLEHHLDAQVMNAQELFALSVEKQDAALASLAWKVASEKTGATTTKAAVVKARPAKAIRKIPSTKKPTLLRLIKKADFIQECVEHPSYRTVGAAMILAQANTETMLALREVGSHWANEFWKDEKFPESSLLFKGFKNDPLDSRSLVPMERESGVSRNETYWVSPTYLSVTTGLKMMQEYGLVTTEVRWSKGARKPEADQRSLSTTRKYYVFKLTAAGKQLKDEWGDVEKFVRKFWHSRKQQKAA